MTSPQQINGYNKRERDSVTENSSGSSAKKQKITSDPVSQINSVISHVKNAIQTCEGFQPTHSKEGELKDKLVQKLNHVNDYLFATLLLIPKPSYSFNQARLSLFEAMRWGNQPDTQKYLEAIINNNDLDRLLNYIPATKLNENLAQFLSMFIRSSSEPHFSALIRAIQQKSPSLLSDEKCIRNIRTAFYSEKCADCPLVISSEKETNTISININKTYLAAIVPYFQCMCFGANNWKEKEQSELKLITQNLQSRGDVPLKQENVYDVIRYCHTRTIYFRGLQDCFAILLLADKWHIDPLVKMCELHLAANLNDKFLHESFEKVWEIAKSTQCTELKDKLLGWAVIQFFKENNNPVIAKILEEEQGQIRKLIFKTACLKADQLDSIPQHFPAVREIVIKQFNTQHFVEQLALFQKLEALNKVKLIDSGIHLVDNPGLIEWVLSTDLPLTNTIVFLDSADHLVHLNENQAKKLRFLEIRNGTSRLPFLKKCENLESLNITIRRRQGLTHNELSSLKKLKDVTLKIEEGLADILLDMTKWVILWDQVEHLKLNYSESYSQRSMPNSSLYKWEDVGSILKTKGELPYFQSFESNIPVPPQFLFEMSLNIPFMRHLSLVTPLIESTHRIHFLIFPTKPELISLKWDCSKGIPPISFLKSLENIQELELINAKLNGDVIQQLKQFPFLHTLRFVNVENLTDAALRELAQLPLESLRMEGCHEITDQGIGHFGSCKTLQKIVIHKCQNISERSMLVPHVRVFEHSPVEIYNDNTMFDSYFSINQEVENEF